VCNPARL